MITLYGIKNCGSVKKAMQFLSDHTLAYTFVDFKISPVETQKITQWVEKVGLSLVLNTKGTTYRTLNLKSLTLTDQEKIMWMAKENRLIKRPVIEYNNQLIVGFNLSTYEGIFLP
jgi:Spx/MgsR family transcriptional regulator